MPIVVRRKLADSPAAVSAAQPKFTVPGRQRRRTDDFVREVAPIIAEIRRAGHHNSAEIAKCLNERGFRAPSGGLYSRETTRRIQKDMERLGVGDGPRTRSAALRARHEKEQAREAMKLAELRERRKREHPDWDR